MDDYCNMTSKLKALGDYSDHYLQGAGAYCVGPTIGRIVVHDVVLKQ